MSPDDPYVDVTRFELGADVDPDVFAASFVELADSNLILQLRMFEKDGRLVQSFRMADPDALVRRASVAGGPPDDRALDAQTLIDAFVDSALDISVDPPAQMLIIDIGDGTHVGAVRSSRHVLGRPRWLALWARFREIYAERVKSADASRTYAVPTPPADLADRINLAWQRTRERIPAARDFWLPRLPADLPPLALPTISLGAAARYTARLGGYTEINLDDATCAAIFSCASELGADPEAVVHAALAALVFRYGDNQTVPIVRYFHNPQVDLGDPAVFRVSPRPTIVSPERDMRFADLVAQVEVDTAAVEQWQDVPLELLDLPHRIDIENGIDPAFQVGLRYWESEVDDTGIVPDTNAVGGTFSAYRRFRPTTDLELSVTNFGTSMKLGIHYCSDLFDPRVIDDVAGHFRNLLTAFVADPAVPITAPTMLSDAERQRLLVDWNQTDVAYRDDVTISDLLNESFVRNPDRVALTFRGENTTFAQLRRGAAALAEELLAHDVKVGDRVALMIDRSPRMIEAIIATLAVGAAYVPMETDIPAQRAADLVEISGAVCAIADHAVRATLPQSLPTVWADDDRADAPDANLPSVAFGPDELAYVLFTSGSTGRPKAAQVRHSGIVNLINWVAVANSIDRDDVVMLKSPYAHDISVPEILLPLFLGGRMIIAEPDGHRDPNYLVDLVKREAVSVIHFVPTMLAEFVLVADQHRPIEIKHVFVGGEGLTRELAQQVLSFPGWTLHNLYGTTEASDYSTAWDVDLADTAQICPIGRPIYNVRLYVLGPDNEPRPVGIPGELCVAGISVGAGYLGAPEATAKAFVADPFAPGIMYRSGDICRYRPDGILEYVRRGDGEVKIHGHRVDLNEIEARVAEHPAVTLAAIMVREDSPGVRRLVAYAETPDTVTARELREWCAKTLAEYMVPAVFVTMPEFPYTLSGKIDRAKLPPPAEPVATKEEDLVAPANPMEELVAGVWCEVLGIPFIGTDQDLYDLGGDSIMAIRIASALQRRGYDVTVKDVFEAPTVASLAATLVATDGAEDSAEDLRALWQDRVTRAVAAGRPARARRTRPSSSVQPNVLLTGATGFLGRHVVAGLLEQTDSAVTCVVRGSRANRDSGASAHDVVFERVITALGQARPHLSTTDIRAMGAGRLQVIDADLQANALGIDRRTWDMLAEQTTSVLHIGAWVHHLHPYSRLAPSNVAATSELLKFAAEAGGIPLRFISTLAAVLYDGGVRLGEDEAAPPPDSGGYVESKWVAEQAVRESARLGDPVQIIRPPWLYGSSVDGAYNPDDALTRLILGSIGVGAVPEVLGIEPILCVNHAVDSLIDSDLFSDPTNASAYLPFLNVETSDIIEHVRTLGRRVDVLPVDEWRERIVSDPENPAAAILSDFGLAVGEDPAAARRECPVAPPIVGPRDSESLDAIFEATDKMVQLAF